jgi:hypothetical protein
MLAESGEGDGRPSPDWTRGGAKWFVARLTPARNPAIIKHLFKTLV